MKRRVEVSLLGQKFTLSSEKEAAHVHAVASYVSRRFEELARSTRTKSTHELALLVALNIAEELFQAEERAATMNREMKARTERVLSRVDAALAANEDVGDRSPSRANVGPTASS